EAKVYIAKDEKSKGLTIVSNISEIAVGESLPLTAKIKHTNQPPTDIIQGIFWSSSDDNIASIDNGQLKAKAAGKVTISATLDPQGEAIKTTKEIDILPAKVVGLRIFPEDATVSNSLNKTFKLYQVWSDQREVDVTQQAQWSNNNTYIASTTKGTTSTHHAGKVEIKASYENLHAIAHLDIGDHSIDDVKVTPNTAITPLGKPYRLTATGTYTDGSTSDITDDAWISWMTANTDTTEEINAVFIPKHPGFVYVDLFTVGSEKIINAKAMLEVIEAIPEKMHITPQNIILSPGEEQTIALRATLTDGESVDLPNDQVKWVNDYPEVASISEGNITALKKGQTKISAIYQHPKMKTRVLASVYVQVNESRN
ncbi:MAG: Ig-like domain-containing protein, partial [Cellvibrionales bacterium]|nr:Ig-like domain-containing protein [Cellvibrionales bacterium]